MASEMESSQAVFATIAQEPAAAAMATASRTLKASLLAWRWSPSDTASATSLRGEEDRRHELSRSRQGWSCAWSWSSRCRLSVAIGTKSIASRQSMRTYVRDRSAPRTRSFFRRAIERRALWMAERARELPNLRSRTRCSSSTSARCAAVWQSAGGGRRRAGNPSSPRGKGNRGRQRPARLRRLRAPPGLSFDEF